MFKCIKKIEKVNHEFIISDNCIYYLFSDGGIKNYSLKAQDECWYTKSEILHSLIKYDDMLLSDNSEHNQYIFNLDNGEFIPINDNFPKAWKQDLVLDKFLLATFTNVKRESALYNLENGTYLWKSDEKIGNNFYFSDSERLIVYNEKRKYDILKAAKLTDGKHHWKLDISKTGQYQNDEGELKQGEVKKILGAYNGIFWVAITNHKLLGIDVDTGEIIHELRDIPDFKCAWLPSAIPDPYGMHLDEKNGKIIGFRWEFYWEIDLNQEKPEIKLYNLLDYFRELGVRSTLADYVLTDDYIYFSEFESGKIGAFNRATKKVDWLHRLEHIKDDALDLIIRKLDYDNNRLFVLDSEGTLHIFEKE